MAIEFDYELVNPTRVRCPFCETGGQTYLPGEGVRCNSCPKEPQPYDYVPSIRDGEIRVTVVVRV